MAKKPRKQEKETDIPPKKTNVQNHLITLERKQGNQMIIYFFNDKVVFSLDPRER